MSSDVLNSKGIVEKINQNDKGFYSFLLGGEWFGAGKYAPKFNEGDEISFGYKKNGQYNNLEFNTVAVLENAPKSQTEAASPASSGKVDWDAKDRRITYLACRKDALSLATVAAELGAITLPTKKDEKLDQLKAFVDEYTDIMFNDVYGESFAGDK